MYHLLTGNVPASAQERFIVPESLPPIRKINPDVSKGLAQVIMAAMAPHPKDRPASVRAWQQMLHSFDTTRPIASTTTSGTDWPTTLRENWWLVGVAAVMLVASLWITFN